jgi:2C-methyl-D-erythritol 2,4-cyclodiphosphate synthase
MLSNNKIPFRTGFGIDFHQLMTGRELWIGGVK